MSLLHGPKEEVQDGYSKVFNFQMENQDPLLVGSNLASLLKKRISNRRNGFRFRPKGFREPWASRTKLPSFFYVIDEQHGDFGTEFVDVAVLASEDGHLSYRVTVSPSLNGVLDELRFSNGRPGLPEDFYAQFTDENLRTGALPEKTLNLLDTNGDYMSVPGESQKVNLGTHVVLVETTPRGPGFNTTHVQEGIDPLVVSTLEAAGVKREVPGENILGILKGDTLETMYLAEKVD